jgi:ABC-type Fe3+-hydroxamate transport system substrate-binding protein
MDKRIISLLPSATEIVAALGLMEALVGRSHECDYPREVVQLPICTEARLNPNKPSREIDADVQSLLQSALSIYQLKTDVIEQLQPTHIITQDQCDVCAVNFPEEVIIIMPCGFDLERTRQESQVLTRHPDWNNLEAVKQGKVFITDGNAYFNRPGPRLVDSLEILAEILHPDGFNFGHQGKAWQPLG